MPWSSGDSLSPTNLNRRGFGASAVVNVQEYGALGDGSTDDTSAFTRALSAVTRGDTVFVPSTRSGYVLSSTVTVPADVTLTGVYHGLRTQRWVDGAGLSSVQSGQGAQLRLSNMTNPAIVLHDNASAENLIAYYPGQSWGLTSVSSSFVTYAPTIQLGVSGADVFTPAVRGVHFLGSTVCIDQGDSTGQACNGVQVEDCSGVLLGPFLRLRTVSDPATVQNCHFNPAYAIAFVTDSTVGGSATAFRTKAAQLATVFEFGQVSDFFANNVYAFGAKHVAHYNRDFYTGDLNEECGGLYTNVIGDVCHQAFRVDRNNNITPLSVVGGRFVPNFRPNGSDSDASTQGLLSLRSSVQSFRAAFVNCRVHGTALDSNFVTSYTSRASFALVADAPLTDSSADNIFVTNVFFDSLTNTIVDSNISGAVRLGPHTMADVSQAVRLSALTVDGRTDFGSPVVIDTSLQPALRLTAGVLSMASVPVAPPSSVSGRGYFWVDSVSSIYWVNGSGVSTLVA